MTPTQAQALVERIRDSGLLTTREQVWGKRIFGTDQWNVHISGWAPHAWVGSLPTSEILHTPEDWTALATERGAAGVGTMYSTKG